MRLSLHSLFTLITDIGDSACLLALVVVGSIYLFSRGSRRAAVFLLASFFIASFLIALLKLAFFGCHSHFHSLEVRSPSGHAAIAASVFWAVAILMRSQLDTNRRFLPLAAFTILIALIAVSRVWLQAHTTPEVCIGLMTGYISIQLARFLVLRKHGLSPFDAYVLLIWCIVALFIAHGYRMPAEEWLRSMASHLHRHLSLCNSTY